MHRGIHAGGHLIGLRDERGGAGEGDVSVGDTQKKNIGVRSRTKCERRKNSNDQGWLNPHVHVHEDNNVAENSPPRRLASRRPTHSISSPLTHLSHDLRESVGDLGLTKVRNALDLGGLEGLQQLHRPVTVHVRRRHGLHTQK